MAFDILIAEDGEVQTIQHTESFSLVTDEITAQAGYSDIGKTQHDIVMLIIAVSKRALEMATGKKLDDDNEEDNTRICIIGALLAANMAANIIDKRSNVDKRFEGYADEFADITDKLFNRVIKESGIDMNFTMITEEQRKQMISDILMKELEEQEGKHE